jgi:hypothetical protein
MRAFMISTALNTRLCKIISKDKIQENYQDEQLLSRHPCNVLLLSNTTGWNYTFEEVASARS